MILVFWYTYTYKWCWLHYSERCSIEWQTFLAIIWIASRVFNICLWFKWLSFTTMPKYANEIRSSVCSVCTNYDPFLIDVIYRNCGIFTKDTLVWRKIVVISQVEGFLWCSQVHNNTPKCMLIAIFIMYEKFHSKFIN